MTVPIKTKADSPARVAPTMGPVFWWDSEAFASSGVTVLVLKLAVDVALRDAGGSVADVLVYGGVIDELLQ